jgi:hypothetical protein
MSPVAVGLIQLHHKFGHKGDSAEFSFFSNKAHAFLDLAANILNARITKARGDQGHEIEYWRKAVEIQDGLNYGEPPE